LDNINVKQINNNMYEAIEHYKVYKQKQKVKQELDKLIHKLIRKNGVTNI